MNQHTAVLTTLLCLASATALANDGGVGDGGLHFEGADAVGMAPVKAFERLESPDLQGRQGRLHTFTLSAPLGATALRFELSAAAAGAPKWRYRVTTLTEQQEFAHAGATVEGALPGTWSERIPVAKVKVILESDAPIAGRLVVSVDGLSQAIQRIEPRGIVGERNVYPYADMDEPVKGLGTPVARIIYVDRGFEKYCTGFLVSEGLLVTNHHCIATQRVLDSAWFDFRYDRHEIPAQWMRGGRLLFTEASHDVTFLRLNRDTSAYGRLGIDPSTPVTGRPLRVIHHPGGRVKHVSDRLAARPPAASVPAECQITSLRAEGAAGSRFDLKHGCDTEGGSSGAPVLDVSTHRVIALHHLGCEDRDCNASRDWVNQAVPFEEIFRLLRREGQERLLAEIAPALQPEATPAQAPALRPETAPEPAFLPASFGNRFSIHEENDVFGLTDPTDSFYTQGLRINARWRVADEHRVGQRFAWETDELIGFELGQNIYTPANIYLPGGAGLTASDRPFAGYLYVGGVWEAQSEARPALGNEAFQESARANLMVEVAVGRTGPRALGGPIQTNWHSLLRAISGRDDPGTPQGWGLYEIGPKTSLDVSVMYQQDLLGWRRDLPWLTERIGADLGVAVSPRARVAAGGLLLYAQPGIEARLGLFPSHQDAGARRLSGEAVRGRRGAPGWLAAHLYLFARADGRLTLHNGLITGPLLNGLSTDARPALLVGDVTVGGVVRLGALELVFSQLWRTNELAAPPAGTPPIHNVGQLNLNLLF